METIVSEWTIAIEALDYDSVKSLYKSNPQLLWTPLELSSHLESDFAPFIDRLNQVEKLGTSLRPLFAFQHILLDFATANDEFAADRLTLVEFFLQNSTAEQLNTCVWGSAQNTVLHLAYFINHSNLIDQLLSKGALPKINALGYLPSQIKEQVKLMFSKRDNKAFLKNVPSADRFRQLQKFAADSSNQQQQQQQQQKKMERNKSTRHYFRPGHIEERKKKVLNEEEEKKRMMDRQKEVELLAQRSAVKNNPLYKILEDKTTTVNDENNDDHHAVKGLQQQQQQQQSQQQQQQKEQLLNNNDHRRASRVITSLKDNSYVSNSVFRQQKITENDTDTVPSLEQLRAAAVTREIEGSSLSREMTSIEEEKQQQQKIENIMTVEEVIQEEAEVGPEKRSSDINYNNEEKEDEREEEDEKDKKSIINSVENNNKENNQVMTEEEEEVQVNTNSSTMSYTSQTTTNSTGDPDNVSGSLDTNTLAHSTMKEEDSTDILLQDNNDDDTPYLPNNNTNTIPTPISFHDSDNLPHNNDETASSSSSSVKEIQEGEEEEEEETMASLQNTPTDTLYETEEAITPTVTSSVTPNIKDDYFSEITQTDPVKHNSHWETVATTYHHQLTLMKQENLKSLEQVDREEKDDDDDNDNDEKQDLQEFVFDDLFSDNTNTNIINNNNNNSNNEEEEEGILEFRGLSNEISRDDKNEWYDTYKRLSNKAESTIRSSLSSCKQSNSTENTNYNQEYEEEEEHFDYYSTKLHTDLKQQLDEEVDDKRPEGEGIGEITVYLDQSSLQDQKQQSSTDLQTLDIRNLSNISFHNHSNLTLSSSVSSTRSSVIGDPTKPRIEDISYYMSTLPVFEKAALMDEEDEENHSSKRECNSEEARYIPNAHEIYYGTSPIPSTFGKDPSSSALDMLPPPLSLNSTEDLPSTPSGKGKLYIGIRGAHNMLLPIPNELTYARCVISDGKYEYISRYEILGREILLDYETVLDTLPGTIITVSLQVRPDYHVMPRTGLISKFFTSARKQKEQLSGYVHAKDLSISQTRFSVDAMMPKCYKKTYQSHFDCFNSWYTMTSQERSRDPEDMLKIVGRLTVEMLYLPIHDETKAPKSLRECDLTLKIKQWHATCWRSGYLSIKNDSYERHFYRLIGSQLIGYDEQSQIYACYNMAKVLRLEGDSTLFRLVFKDHFIECKSETRHWFRTFKSMIGRVPMDFTI